MPQRLLSLSYYVFVALDKAIDATHMMKSDFVDIKPDTVSLASARKNVSKHMHRPSNFT